MMLEWLKLWNLTQEVFQPLIISLCFLGAWGMLILTVVSLFRWVLFFGSRAKIMHRIPCSDCTFFTGEYQLKCTVRPHIALSEEAINCPDFCHFSTNSRRF